MEREPFRLLTYQNQLMAFASGSARTYGAPAERRQRERSAAHKACVGCTSYASAPSCLAVLLIPPLISGIRLTDEGGVASPRENPTGRPSFCGLQGVLEYDNDPFLQQ